MRWSLFILSLASFTVQSIVIRHDVSDQMYLTAASSDNSTVTFWGMYNGEEIVEGTGTLISPEWIITAAHVAKYLQLGGKIQFQNAFYSIAKVQRHPGWEEGKIPFDIAVVKVSQPIQEGTYAKLYDSEDEVGKIATFVGKGDTGNGLRGVLGADKQKRFARNEVTDASGEWIQFIFDRGDKALPLEGISGPGDSGGPANITIDEELYLIGVSSWQNTEPAQ